MSKALYRDEGRFKCHNFGENTFGELPNIAIHFTGEISKFAEIANRFNSAIAYRSKNILSNGTKSTEVG